MKLLSFLLIFIITFTLISACHTTSARSTRVFIVQPFNDLPFSQAKAIYGALKKTNPNTILKDPISLPSSAYYATRNRYRADSLINYLNRSANVDTVIIGLTSKDISTTKGNIADWGVMGLGFEPGNACVVSTFRLPKNKLSDQYYKLALHELGHTQGLPHCNNKTCLMRDAEGGNHLDEETGFCPTCRSFLKSKRWILN